MSIDSFALALMQDKIRKTPNNRASILDVIEHVTGKDKKGALRAWNNACANHNEFIAYASRYKFLGSEKSTPVAAAEHLVEIIMTLPGEKAGRLRKSAAELICRYLEADISLADDIVQRNESTEDLEWLSKRVQGKVRRKELTDTMKAHGADRSYGLVSDMNNKLVLGKTAKEFKKEKRLPERATTRDHFASEELTLMATAELLEKNAILSANSQGDSEIKVTATTVAEELRPIYEKYRNPVNKKN